LENPHEGVLYVSDLEPISRDEMPSSDYFFSKKRKAVLKQESHPVGERTVKKHKIIIDGKKLKESEFATELAGTMGAIALDKYVLCRKFDHYDGAERSRNYTATGQIERK
jgi:hypothetical protein